MEIGIYSFGEFKPGVMPGVAQTPGERLRNLIEEVELADQVGLDVFGIGEHHRPDFTVSSPPVVLAAAAFTLEQYAESAALRGAYCTGSPEQVIEKILFQHELFGHERCLVKFTTGPVPHRHVLRSIELLGTVVAPAVRAEVARRTARPA